MAATGREARAERLNDRLRGAGRAVVGDDSFNLDIPGIDLEQQVPTLPTVPDSETPRSAKRRKLDSGASHPVQQQDSPERPSGGSTTSSVQRRLRGRPPANKDPYDLSNTSKESVGQQQVASPAALTRSVIYSSGGRLVPEPEEADLSVTRVIAALQFDPSADADELESIPSLRGRTGPWVEPSPPAKRGSSVLRSEARKMDAGSSDGPVSPSVQSSPLVRRSSILASRRKSREERQRSSLAEETIDDEDELSPDRPREKPAGRPAASATKRPISRRVASETAHQRNSSVTPRSSPLELIDELSPDHRNEQGDADVSRAAGPIAQDSESRPEAMEVDEAEEAEQVDEIAAAAALGKKRARPVRRGSSPELGSHDSQEPEPEPESEVEPEQPAAKKKRAQPKKSPAKQKQPIVKPKTKTTARKQPAPPRKSPPTAKTQAKSTAKPAAKPTAKRKSSPKAQRRRSGDDENAAFEVTVQRFVHHKKRRGRKPAEGAAGSGSDSDGDGLEQDADPLQLEIPFANRAAESPVDVFAQLCEEVIGNMLVQFEEHLHNAPDAARKKEVRVKIRALEAYREELNLRLLQHAIHLNNWYTLRKRVRQAQKEKLALRDEILRLRGEREQVALRMDAVRIKHEKETKESSFLLNTSSVMRDIDQAVKQGQDAPELAPKAQREAELANLELVVAQVVDQVGSTGSGGGMLGQIQDFNAFLERAAVALESR